MGTPPNTYLRTINTKMMWLYRFFSKSDAKQGYWNVKLDAASSLMTAFYTPSGRYNFLRIPFGLRMIWDICQRKTDQTYGNCRDVVGMADDMKVFGKQKTHDRNLHKAVECTRRGRHYA